MKEYHKSAAALAYYRMNPLVPSAAMELGTAVHLLVLEPERAGDIRLIDAPLTGKVMNEERATRPHGQVVLQEGQMPQAEAMVASLVTHPTCRPLVQAITTEVTLIGYDVWPAAHWYADSAINTMEVPLATKARLDAVDADGAIWDIKTTGVDLDRFEHEIIHRNMWLQAAWYQRALCWVHGTRLEDHPFRFAVVSSKAPYETRVYALEEEFRNYAHQRIEQLLISYRAEVSADDPTFIDPSPPAITGVQEVALPGYLSFRHALVPFNPGV
jgi:hypothetical protein